MSLRLGDVAPDFKAQTTGEISLYEYLGNSWGYYFLTQQITLLFVQPSWAKPHY